jgi:hypothetical protein
MAHNEVNILTSDVVIVLPGLKGTQCETSLALVCDKPVVLFGQSEDFEEFPTTPPLAENIDQVDRFIQTRLENRHGGSDESSDELLAECQ